MESWNVTGEAFWRYLELGGTFQRPLGAFEGLLGLPWRPLKHLLGPLGGPWASREAPGHPGEGQKLIEHASFAENPVNEGAL